VEKLLKRQIPRVELPAGFDGAERESRSPRHEAKREERAPRGGRHAPEREPSRSPRGSHRGEKERDRDHRPAHAKPHVHKAPAASDFDFSKPYEPAAKSESSPTADAAALPHRGRAKRPTAALLGGSTHHSKSRK
jgi:hypothetical protein